jgi:hypothetical protein
MSWADACLGSFAYAPAFPAVSALGSKPVGMRASLAVEFHGIGEGMRDVRLAQQSQVERGRKLSATSPIASTTAHLANGDVSGPCPWRPPV